MRILGHACLLRSIAVLHTLSIQSLVLKVIRFGAFLWKKKNRFPWNFSKWKNSVVYPVGYDPPLYILFNKDQMTKCSSLQKRQTDHSLLHSLGYQRHYEKDQDIYIFVPEPLVTLRQKYTNSCGQWLPSSSLKVCLCYSHISI